MLSGLVPIPALYPRDCPLAIPGTPVAALGSYPLPRRWVEPRSGLPFFIYSLGFSILTSTTYRKNCVYRLYSFPLYLSKIYTALLINATLPAYSSSRSFFEKCSFYLKWDVAVTIRSTGNSSFIISIHFLEKAIAQWPFHFSKGGLISNRQGGCRLEFPEVWSPNF